MAMRESDSKTDILSASGAPVRMLRVEFKAQPYDWFNLEEMGSLVRSEDFAHTLRENINHYFNVPFDYQAVFDEDGLLIAPVDFARALQHPRPYFRVYDTREMPQDLKDQTSAKLSSLAYEVTKAQRSLGSYDAREQAGAHVNGTSSDAASQGTGGLPVSPWPVRAQDYQSSSSLADRLSANGSTSSVPQSQTYNGSQSDPRSAMPQNFGQSAGMQVAASAIPPSAAGTLGTPRVPGGYQPAPCGQASATQQSGYSTLRTYDVGGTMEVILSKDLSSGRAEKFGFANVPAPDGRSLEINWVDGSGLMAKWNREHPDKQVREGDVILSVNNKSDNLEAMRAQLQADTIRMVVKSVGARPGTGGHSMGVRGQSTQPNLGSGQLPSSLQGSMASMQAMQHQMPASTVPGGLQGMGSLSVRSMGGTGGTAMMNNLGSSSLRQPANGMIGRA